MLRYIYYNRHNVPKRKQSFVDKVGAKLVKFLLKTNPPDLFIMNNCRYILLLETIDLFVN